MVLINLLAIIICPFPFCFAAGHSLSTFELTITRIATRVKKIVSDKIGSTDLENEDDLESYDESYDESSDDAEDEEVAEDDKDEDNNDKWKRRRRRRHRSRKKEKKRLPSSSSDYESDDEFDKDSVIGSGHEDNAANDDDAGGGNFDLGFTLQRYVLLTAFLTWNHNVKVESTWLVDACEMITLDKRAE